MCLGTFRSVPDLSRAIEAYVTYHDRRPPLFISAATATSMLKQARRCEEALQTAP
jgi:hypothetical protein